jgi:RimJ/RimL family protein N-acetyltransferase
MGDDWELDDLAGDHVRLRAPRMEDLDAFTRFADSDGDRRAGRTTLPRTLDHARRWLEGLVNADRSDDTTFLVIESREGDVVGSTSVSRADRRNRVFGYGLALLPPYRRKGFGTEAARLLLRFYFDELGYQRCESEVYAFNESSISFHEKLGFVVEGRRRRAVYTQGTYHDALIIGLLREHFDR